MLCPAGSLLPDLNLILNLHPAGPLLLNALLQHLGAGGEHPARTDPKTWPAWLPALGTAAFGYWCAALLGVTSAAKASHSLIPCSDLMEEFWLLLLCRCAVQPGQQVCCCGTFWLGYSTPHIGLLVRFT